MTLGRGSGRWGFAHAPQFRYTDSEYKHCVLCKIQNWQLSLWGGFKPLNYILAYYRFLAYPCIVEQHWFHIVDIRILHFLMSQNWLTYFKPQKNLTDYIRLTMAGKREMISVNCLFVCRQSSAVSVPSSAPDFWACNAFLTTSDTILKSHKKHSMHVNGWLSRLQMLLLHIIISK